MTKLTKAEQRTKTLLAELINLKHPVAMAIEPLREEAIERAEADAKKKVEFVRKELAAAGNDINAVAPYPAHNLRRSEYWIALSRYLLFRSLCTWRTASGRSGEPQPADVDPEKVETFVKESKENAAHQYDAFVVKLCRKIGDCESASISGSHVWGWSILTVEKTGGREVWKTQQIVNVSKLGTLFNQWPSRKLKAKE